VQPLPDDDFYAIHGDWSSGLNDREAQLVVATVLDLTEDSRTRHEPVRVSAQNDVVILSGTVASWAARDAATTIAQRTPGVRDLCNTLRVAGDARDGADADPFDRLTAPMASPSEPVLAPAGRPSRGRTYLLAITLTAAAWCALPIAVLGAHLPALPVLLVVLAVSVLAVSLQLLSIRR